jgi:hypothetical protein
LLLAPPPPPPSATIPAEVEAAIAVRDAPLVDRTPVRSGASGGPGTAECLPPATDQRVCSGWPVCRTIRPTCEQGTEPRR